MKKLSLVAVVLFVLLLCVGCGSKEKQPDAVSQKMIDDINAIGEVTLDDEENINKLLNTYTTLTDKQKESVNNYAVLLEAQDSLQELQKEKNESEQKKLDEKLNEIHMKNAILAAKTLKKNLNNPDSFNLHEVVYSDFKTGNEIVYQIKYSGENKMGGSTDKTVIVDVLDDKQTIYDEDSSNYVSMSLGMMKVINGTSDAKESGFGEAVYLDVDFISEHIDD